MNDAIVASARTRMLLDPWSSDYQASVQADGVDASASEVQVDVSVETGHWTGIPAGSPPQSAAFVDGVRRLEARLIGVRQDSLIHGLFASYATGAAVITPNSACFTQCVTARRLVLDSGVLHSETLRVGNIDLHFKGLAAQEPGPDALVLALQGAMRDAEQKLASDIAEPIVFLDGPLAFTTEPRGPVVGVIKTIHRLYLGRQHMELAVRLQTGQRTPVFAVSEGRKTRYSWYLRVGERRATHHAFAGLMRLEAAAAGGLDAAVRLAGVSARFLPRFASSPNRDPRAPQNLTPVGALEEHLRNGMGDATLIQRAIECRIAEGLEI